MTRKLTIDSFTISDDSDYFVIAEIGHNHQGNLEKAKQLFRAAKAAYPSLSRMKIRMCFHSKITNL